MTNIDTVITEMQPLLDRTISLGNFLITNTLSGAIYQSLKRNLSTVVCS